ncbi:MAG: helix-turn-helix domain-containing protein [Flavobacteriales bacterium]|nr:helix-turn-helix domain-containing protein [Flavobacteriales bacterium]MCW8937663.1 helix-turn-helix domain-containing protein [Flavobacteriales bacterium]MCW8967575.1 helix-turn-helix domain-containing protein [Flavobacteriales bacterium]MCW8990151.1 helix-turn-helix domain-containing protein [Flavobacteriales bacterium]MCW9019869.1 helix-turn-helix domain-containing protein [Flavobacteriales bacterium]
MKQGVDIELLNKIALRIKTLREEKNITQEIFYNDTGINIGRIERSKRNFSMSTLKRICDYLEITLKDFFSEGF